MFGIHSGIVRDVAVLPMLLFNPITIGILLITLVLIVVSVVSVRARRKKERELEEKIKRDADK